jgi:hypothetical protein
MWCGGSPIHARAQLGSSIDVHPSAARTGFSRHPAHGVRATPAHADRRMACTLVRQEVHMSLTTILIIVLIIALLGGGGYYWRR